MATKVPMITKFQWQHIVPMATKVPIATKVPMATKVLMATKVDQWQKEFQWQLKELIAQIAQNLTLAVWLHMKYGLVFVKIMVD